jgi:hypothetical protein
LLEAIAPFAAGARANACGLTGGLRRLSTKDHFGQPLSTVRRQTGILMDDRYAADLLMPQRIRTASHQLALRHK